MSEALLFAFSLVDTGSVLFLLVYFVLTLSDLECNYLNSQECCSRLNTWVLPKLIAHAILVPLFLLYGYWLLVIINLPIIIWMGLKLYSVPVGNIGYYDPTEILVRGQLKSFMQECVIYLAWYLISFFIYLYCMIVALIEDSPLQQDDTFVSEF